jgi:hypothetical protein
MWWLTLLLLLLLLLLMALLLGATRGACSRQRRQAAAAVGEHAATLEQRRLLLPATHQAHCEVCCAHLEHSRLADLLTLALITGCAARTHLLASQHARDAITC